MEKLKQGDTAIIDYYKFSQPKKVEVLEETETTYLLLDVDYEKGRDFIVDTNMFTEEATKQIVEDFKTLRNQEFKIASEPSNPRVEVIAAKFRITKEEFEKTYKIIDMVRTMEQKIADEKFWRQCCI
jgi:hypothetical protein